MTEKIKKLEIGTGPKGKIDESWIAMDCVEHSDVDIVHDCRVLPLPIESGSVGKVLMNHVLEHLPWWQSVDFLKEVYRILKPGGSVEIWVPDFSKIMLAYFDRDTIKNDKWWPHNPEHDLMLWINGRIFCRGPEPEMMHRALFDYEHLKSCLIKAGFEEKKILNLNGESQWRKQGPYSLGIGAAK